MGFIFLASCSSMQQQNKTSAIDPDCAHTVTSFNCVKVVEVYDGDTIFINLPDQHPQFGKRMGVRISGIGTPEIRTKNACEKRKGQKAKKVLENIIARANRVDVVDVSHRAAQVFTS